MAFWGVSLAKAILAEGAPKQTWVENSVKMYQPKVAGPVWIPAPPFPGLSSSGQLLSLSFLICKKEHFQYLLHRVGKRIVHVLCLGWGLIVSELPDRW